MKTRLCELAEKYGTDKVKSIYHDYTPYYSRLLEGRNVRRVLEVGIGTPVSMTYPGYRTGASLKMWSEYFPEARIYGVDLDPQAMFTTDRIITGIADADSVWELQSVAVEFGGDFDLIIDDGSHKPEHQVNAALALVPFLAEGGVFVIEDVKDPSIVWKLPYTSRIVEFQPELRSQDNRMVIINSSEVLP